MIRARSALLAIALGMLPWTGDISQARAEAVPEYEMKAAYLYNFALLTHWPADMNTIRLCVYGKDRFGGALEKMARNSPPNRRIVLTYLAQLGEARDCQILFVDRSAQPSGSDTAQLASLAGQPILTVTDSPDLFGHGIMIGMFMEKNRLVFDVNQTLAVDTNLSLSSKMLRVARRVINED